MPWTVARSTLTITAVAGEAYTSSPAQFCEACGERLADDARFCERCGQAIPATLDSPPRAGPPREQAAPGQPLTPDETPTSPGPPTRAPSSGAAPGWGLERFHVQGVLGRGGSGTVYLAYDAVLDRDVALKVLSSDLSRSPAFLERFWAEAQTLSRLEHPNVVALFDYGQDGDQAWLATEYVPGASLRQLIDHAGSLTAPQALGVLAGALRGLGCVHETGLVHGDLTTGNILVDREGVSKLADFGESIGPAGRGMGVTPTYASPEAAAGAPLDARSDLYSLAVVLYECLAGHPPFGGAPAEVVLHQHATAAPPPILGLPAPLGDLVAAGLAKDPAYRPQSAAEFLDRLEQAAAVSEGPSWRERGALAGLAAAVGGELAALVAPELASSGAAGDHHLLHLAEGERGAHAVHLRHPSQVVHPSAAPHAPTSAPAPQAPAAPEASSPLTPPRVGVWRRLATAMATHKVVTAATVATVLVGGGGAAYVAGGGIAPPPSSPAAPTPGTTVTTSMPEPLHRAPLGAPAASFPTPADAGAWSIRYVPPRRPLQTTTQQSSAVSCPSVRHCVVAGMSWDHPFTGDVPYVYVTDAAGTHPAHAILPPGTPPKELNDVSCPTDRRCVASQVVNGYPSSSGGLLASTDGGRTWHVESLVTGDHGGNSVVSCATSGSCLAVGGGVVDATADAGARWSEVSASNAPPNPSSLDCVSPDTCWATVEDPSSATTMLERTVDGGRTWSTVTNWPGASTSDAYAVSCFGARRCAVTVGASLPPASPEAYGQTSFGVVTTEDGGATWTGHPLATVTGGVLTSFSISCASAFMCAASVKYGPYEEDAHNLSYVTTDGWRTESQVPGPSGFFFSQGLSCPSVTACVATVMFGGAGAYASALAVWRAPWASSGGRSSPRSPPSTTSPTNSTTTTPPPGSAAPATAPPPPALERALVQYMSNPALSAVPVNEWQFTAKLDPNDSSWAQVNMQTAPGYPPRDGGLGFAHESAGTWQVIWGPATVPPCGHGVPNSILSDFGIACSG